MWRSTRFPRRPRRRISADVDLFVADCTFADEGVRSGAALNAAGHLEGSMAIASGDADNDGALDRFATNGAVDVIEAQRGQPSPFRMKNLLFHNEGARRFANVSGEAGPAFALDHVGRGAAFGDLDNDGDIDIVVTNNNGRVRLLINEAARSAHWAQIRLQQDGGNRDGLGAWIGVERVKQPTLWRRVRTDGSYLPAGDVRAHVGLGNSVSVGGVVVRWPDGTRERWARLEADRVTLRRGTGTTEPEPANR